LLPPAPTADEEGRLAALHELDLFDAPREERFGRYVRLARALLDFPIATVSLVDRDWQWFKNMEGLDVAGTSREVSFCGHALHERGVFCVADASLDPRFHDNPLVTGAPFIRAYAGAPLFLPGGHAIGTLCVIDTRPHVLRPSQILRLRDLADALQRELTTLQLLKRMGAAPQAAGFVDDPAYTSLMASF
jgi:GAF domain-containing protein